MSCIPGCLCFNNATDYQHFDASGACRCGHLRNQHKPAKFCLGTYECTCTAGRYEEFAFSGGICVDPACRHVRSRHHDQLPSAFVSGQKSPSIESCLARIMEQNLFGRIPPREVLPPSSAPTKTSVEVKEEHKPESNNVDCPEETLSSPKDRSSALCSCNHDEETLRQFYASNITALLESVR
jgi:hypothetical protein